LARIARGLPPLVLSEIAAVSALLGIAPANFFQDAAANATRNAWNQDGISHADEAREVTRTDDAREVPPGDEARGVSLGAAGEGVGKSIASIVPLLGAAAVGERGIVSTHTLPLQDQLVRKDIPAVQAALGTEVKVAVLKGRANYLCPRRWQIFRGAVATRE